MEDWSKVWNVAYNVTEGALFWTLLLLEAFALLSVPSVLLRRRGRPSAALAWLLALFALPAIGGLLWWGFGRTRLERKKARAVAIKRSFVRRRGSPEPERGTVFDGLFPERAHGDAAFASRGNRVELLADGAAFFGELEETLRAATESIFVQMYIFAADETGRRILGILQEKRRAGVVVRVLVDGFGSQRSERWLRRELEKVGAEFAVFLPTRLFPLHAPRLNFTNHRKLIVVDHRVAFTGGMNLAEEYERLWRDVMVKVEGPLVRGLLQLALEDWYFATNRVLDEPKEASPVRGGIDAAVVGSGPDTEPWIHDAYFLAITSARRTLDIATPYFIPSAPLVTALRTAAGRGVRVRIVVPSVSDVALVKWASRSYYRQLVEAGVAIHEYRGPMLHGKALIQDERIASVGTANVDSRSLGLSFETTCFFDGEALHRELGSWLEGLVQNSDRVTLEAIDQKSMAQKLAESAAHLLSPLL